MWWKMAVSQPVSWKTASCLSKAKPLRLFHNATYQVKFLSFCFRCVGQKPKKSKSKFHHDHYDMIRAVDAMLIFFRLNPTWKQRKGQEVGGQKKLDHMKISQLSEMLVRFIRDLEGESSKHAAADSMLSVLLLSRWAFGGPAKSIAGGKVATVST